MSGKSADKRKGPDGFEAYYGDILGERWPELREALTAETRPYRLDDGLVKPYYLDEASVYAALALEPAAGNRLLDLCAAPGGKTLVLAGRMSDDATLVANERSAERRRRLRAVLDEHVPANVRARISVTGHDARSWGLHERERFDRVLADVPCSSERHVLSSPTHLAKWGPGRSKRLAAQATAILAAAIDTATPGGLVVYATCTVLDAENDVVVERMLERRAGLVELYRAELPFGEQTRAGTRIWPDRSGGRGPMYIARLRKLRESPQ